VRHIPSPPNTPPPRTPPSEDLVQNRPLYPTDRSWLARSNERA